MAGRSAGGLSLLPSSISNQSPGQPKSDDGIGDNDTSRTPTLEFKTKSAGENLEAGLARGSNKRESPALGIKEKEL